MAESLKNKPVALITGASRGIGAATATKLATNGYHVLINYLSNEIGALNTMNSISSAGGNADLCKFDVSDSNQIHEQFKWISENFGKLDVLVNNAGISKDTLLLRLKNEDLNKILSVNLTGVINCTAEAVKLMLKSRQGSIIQISSVVAETGNPGQSAYAAAKAGIIGFSKSVARELASRQIRVNVVTPGFIETSMTEALTDAQKEVILRSIPLGRFGFPEDVAAVVAFLASNDSQYITGQVIGVNGGIYM